MDIKELLDKYIDDGLQQVILSNSRDKSITKEKIRRVSVKGKMMFQTESFRGAQVFHENMDKEALKERILSVLGPVFKQGEFVHTSGTALVLTSKSGTVTIKEKKAFREPAMPAWKPLDSAVPSHNKVKNYLIPEGTPVPFMYDLGVFTAEGKVVRTKTDKYRQINRFLEFVEDIVPALPKDKVINILDFGCGKSYLTFAVYYFLTKIRGLKVKITGLDLKEAVVRDCERLARKYGYEGLSFSCGDVSEFKGETDIDMMMTLHACDTATDYALAFAVKTGAKVILSVPCCQHELNGQLKDTALEPLFRYGIVKERVAALATDALRAELLAAHDYKVQLLEFIDMEHTPKNILIRAVKRDRHNEKACAEAGARVEAFVKGFGIDPTLLKLLKA